MAEEIQEAIQIIRVAYDGIEISLKIGSGSIEAVKKAVNILIGLLEYEKSLGKTTMRSLLKKGGDLQVFQLETKDMKKVEKFAKKYGILYSVLPDINKKDGKSEIIFHTEAVPRINMLIQKLKSGRIATFDDYLKNGEEKELNKLLSFLKGLEKNGKPSFAKSSEETEKAETIIEGLIEKVGRYALEKQSISVEEVKENFNVAQGKAEELVEQLETIGLLGEEDSQGFHKVAMNQEAFEARIQSYQELTQRMRTMEMLKNRDVVDITIARKMVAEENSRAVKTRIPYQKNCYIWIEKEKMTGIHDGKTILTFLDKEKEYKIYSKENKVVKTMRGEELYKQSYDPVTAKIRRDYAKLQPESPVGSKKRTEKKR